MSASKRHFIPHKHRNGEIHVREHKQTQTNSLYSK
jgi:hypothetical protein